MAGVGGINTRRQAVVRHQETPEETTQTQRQHKNKVVGNNEGRVNVNQQRNGCGTFGLVRLTCQAGAQPQNRIASLPAMSCLA